MIFLVQAIKKLFVTCQAVYDVRGLGKGPQSHSIYAHKILSSRKASHTTASHGPVAETVHEKQMKLEGSQAKMR